MQLIVNTGRERIIEGYYRRRRGKRRTKFSYYVVRRDILEMHLGLPERGAEVIQATGGLRSRNTEIPVTFFNSR